MSPTRERLVQSLRDSGFVAAATFADRADVVIEWSPITTAGRVLDLLRTRLSVKQSRDASVGAVPAVVARLEAADPHQPVVVAYTSGADEQFWVYCSTTPSTDPFGVVHFVRQDAASAWEVVH